MANELVLLHCKYILRILLRRLVLIWYVTGTLIYFKSKNQVTKMLPKKICENKILILLDFAQNYSFIVQYAVLGYHWNNSQATTHPIVIHYLKEQMKCKCYCIISDYLKHDTNSVHAFIIDVLQNIKRDVTGLTKCIYFSDGVGTQYKNYKNINFCHHPLDYGVNAEYHFYRTSHGKSPCDVIGWTV